MEYLRPPEPGEEITSEFLSEVARLAQRPITGIGVASDPFGISILQQSGGESVRGYTFRNDSGETVPKYGCLAVSGVATGAGGNPLIDPEGNVIISCVKPSSTFRTHYVLNFDMQVLDGRTGLCFTPGGYDMALALYDTGTPALGEQHGPVPDQWYLAKNYPPIFDCHGVAKSAESTMLGFLHPITGFPIMLKESITPGGTADAYPTEPDGTILSESLYWEVTDTVGDKRARGKDDVAEGEDGALGLAEVLADGTAAIVEIQQQAKRCSAILTADAGPGAAVDVDNVVPLDGGQSPVDESSDTLSTTMPAADRALDNATCKIEWDENADAWLITWVHQQARSIRGTLSGALATSDPSITITSPVSCDGGQVPTGTVTGWNVFSWEGDSGGEVFLVWNETTDHYEIIQCECPA